MQRPPPHSLNFDHCGLRYDGILYTKHTFILFRKKLLGAAKQINLPLLFLTGFISPQGSSEQLNSNAAIFLR